jgi:hypothetical protein
MTVYRIEILVLAGPRLTTNCLTDHRTWYNLQVCTLKNANL